MFLKFFTQKVSMVSPTYANALKDDRCVKMMQDKGLDDYVNMTADITVTEDESDNNPVVVFDIINKMWDDPIKGEDGEDIPFSLTFSLTREQVVYIQKYFEAFLIR